MANAVVTKIESLLATAKADISKDVVYLKHVPWIRLAVVAATLALLITIHKLGYDSVILTIVYNLLLVLTIGTILIEALIIWGNTKIECARIQYLQKDDGAPGPLGGAIQQELMIAGTTEVGKVAPKTPGP